MDIRIIVLLTWACCYQTICQANIVSTHSTHNVEYEITENIILEVMKNHGIGVDLIKHMTRLDNDLASQGETIKYLQENVHSQEASINHLETTNTHLKNEVEGLQAQVKRLEHVMRNIEKDAKTTHDAYENVTILDNDINYIHSALNNATKSTEQVLVNATPDNARIARKNRLVGEGVAFSSYLDHRVMHMGPGHTIKCNQVILNDGAAYNPLTGTFTVPFDGVYLFTFTVEVHIGETEIKLVVDGVNQVDIVSRPSGSGEAIMATNTVIVRVSQGQAVWLENYRGTDSEIISGPDTRHVTFSGFQLY